MIDSAIISIVEELNNSLNVKFRLNEDRVVASNLLNLDGSLSIKDENRIVIIVTVIVYLSTNLLEVFASWPSVL